MASQQKRAPEPKDESTAASGAESGTRTESVQLRLQQAYLDHLQALQNLSSNLQKRQSEALAHYCEQLRSDLQEVSLDDAYQRYLQSLREAEAEGRSDQAPAAEGAEAAGRDLISAVQEAQAKAQRAYESAGRRHAEMLKQAWDDAQEQLRDQYLAYSRILQDVWARINQGDPDPRTLVLLSQSLMAAALTAPLPSR
jgi:hypothetical protein